MAQQANVVAFDGATTPVSHTFIPVDNKVLKDGTRVAIWRENNAALPINAQIRLELYQREFASKVVESRICVVSPVMESVSGQNAAGYTAAPKVAYEDRSEFKTICHPRSTATSRRLAKQLMMNIINNVSTTVTPVSAGFVDEALALLFMPT